MPKKSINKIINILKFSENFKNNKQFAYTKTKENYKNLTKDFFFNKKDKNYIGYTKYTPVIKNGKILILRTENIKKKEKNIKYKEFDMFFNSITNNRRMLDIRSEWYNSIYTFNKNLLRDIPIIYNNIFMLIRNYFNLNNLKIFNKIGIWIRGKKSHLTVNKVFVNRPFIKYTSDFININISIYNRTSHFINYKFKLPSLMKNIIRQKINLKKYKNLEQSLINKGQKLKYKLNLITFEKQKINKQKSIINWYLSNKIYYKNFFKHSIKTVKEFNKYITKNKISEKKKNNFNIHKKKLNIIFINSFFLEKKLIFYYKHLLLINKLLSDNIFLVKLNRLLSKFFNKSFKLNIFNLLYPYMSIDIFTEIITIKEKLRKKSIKTIINKAFYSIKNIKDSKTLYLKRWNKAQKEFNLKKNFLSNKFKNKILVNDNFQLYLNNLFTDFKEEINSVNNIKENYIVYHTKYKNLTGITLKVAGRITKRLVAARSKTVINYIGVINIYETSVLGKYSPIIIGYVRPNVQSLNLTSINRNGSYGLKGWFGTG